MLSLKVHNRALSCTIVQKRENTMLVCCNFASRKGKQPLVLKTP